MVYGFSYLSSLLLNGYSRVVFPFYRRARALGYGMGDISAGCYGVSCGVVFVILLSWQRKGKRCFGSPKVKR